MPRYFIDTFDGIAAFDDTGMELPDRAAIKNEIRQALSGMMHDDNRNTGAVQYRADVRDEHDNRILTATLLMVFDEND